MYDTVGIGWVQPQLKLYVVTEFRTSLNFGLKHIKPPPPLPLIGFNPKIGTYWEPCHHIKFQLNLYLIDPQSVTVGIDLEIACV